MLRTGLISRLLARGPDVRIVLLSPLVNDAAFVREFEHPQVEFVDLPPHQPAGIEARLLSLMQAAYLESGITESVNIRREEARRTGTLRFVRFKSLLARLLAPSVMDRRTRYDLSDRLTVHQHHERLFDRHKPTLVVVASPGLIFAEVPLLRTAARRRVRSLALDASWDNFTNKLLPVRRVDRLIVWNEIMREQAVDLHGYEPEQVAITGAPQFDLYFGDRARASREEFCRRIGADPHKRLITVSTTPRALYSHHDHVLRRLARALDAGELVRPAQVLVRLHPRDELDDCYTPFVGRPGMIIEKPFRPTVRTGDGLAVDVTPENQQHLADTMRHTDVALNVASTIALEACIFDTPVVNIGFDGEQPSEFAASARRYYRFTHYRHLLDAEAVRVAWTADEMIGLTNRYLEDPSLDAGGRRRVLREQCAFTDGRAAERIAACVLDELARATGRVVAGAPAASFVGAAR
jgi:hypothetical protein